MAKCEDAEIAIVAKDKTSAGVKSAKTGIGKLTKVIKGYYAEISAAVAAVYGAVKVIKSLTDAYKIQEEAVAKVEAALKATGTYTPTLSNNLQELASQLQSVTTYGDESTLEMTALLQSLAKLNEEQLMQIIPAIQDFATGMGIDMNTAASLVGKTLGSTTNALSRYGIVIDMTGTKEEKLQELRGDNIKFACIIVSDHNYDCVIQEYSPYGFWSLNFRLNSRLKTILDFKNIVINLLKRLEMTVLLIISLM